MNIVTAPQMRELEQRADASGNSFAQMMEQAGALTAQAILEHWTLRDRHVLVLVGPGNNGGDGLVCARVLHDAGASVHLYIWKRAADENDPTWKLCQQLGIRHTHSRDDSDFAQLRDLVTHTDFIVDALLGTGVSRPIEGDLQTLLQTVKKNLARAAGDVITPDHPTPRPSSPRIIAVDLPTGLNPDTGALDPAALPADLTITFAFPKIGHYTFPGANAVGQLVIADIGIKDETAGPLQVATPDEIRALLPRHKRDSNKGTFGKTMIACGSLNYTGAPVLAAHAAGRIGTGLVTIAVPQTIHAIIATKIDEATFLPILDRAGDWRPRGATELLATLWDTKYDALLVGCGMGRAVSTREFLERLLEGLPTLENPPPLVLDADALNHLAELPEWWTRFSFSAPPILTPHPGEMGRLLGIKTSQVQANRVSLARDAAQQWNAIVVLKGAFTAVAAPDGNVTLIPFANSALATAGTGDVLAGTIAGLVAQFQAQSKRAENFDSAQAAYNAAIVGAYIHALAGEIAAQEIGSVGIVAGDLLTRLPQARQKIVQ